MVLDFFRGIHPDADARVAPALRGWGRRGGDGDRFCFRTRACGAVCPLPEHEGVRHEPAQPGRLSIGPADRASGACWLHASAASGLLRRARAPAGVHCAHAAPGEGVAVDWRADEAVREGPGVDDGNPAVSGPLRLPDNTEFRVLDFPRGAARFNRHLLAGDLVDDRDNDHGWLRGREPRDHRGPRSHIDPYRLQCSIHGDPHRRPRECVCIRLGRARPDLANRADPTAAQPVGPFPRRLAQVHPPLRRRRGWGVIFR
mmetsp:Transcript_97048/g.274529  ORF Transcript_97048/g.274529 Transcript_97048/m.274529 type:complete len:258 (-) Transcript_97048:41-814(-)